jgi:hypothetical protein
MDDFALLGTNAACGFGIPYRSHFQGSTMTALPLNMGQIACPGTSVNNYQHTLHNNIEQRTPRLHRGEILVSCCLSTHEF